MIHTWPINLFALTFQSIYFIRFSVHREENCTLYAIPRRIWKRIYQNFLIYSLWIFATSKRCRLKIKRNLNRFLLFLACSVNAFNFSTSVSSFSVFNRLNYSLCNFNTNKLIALVWTTLKCTFETFWTFWTFFHHIPL